MENVLRFLVGFFDFPMMMSSGYYFSLGLGIIIGILGTLMFVWALYPLIKEGLENEKYKFNRRDFSPSMKERRNNWKKKEKLQKIMVKKTIKKFWSFFPGKGRFMSLKRHY